jgi:hypothetical protein
MYLYKITLRKMQKEEEEGGLGKKKKMQRKRYLGNDL